MNKAHEMLVAYIKAHPEETYSSIALMLGTTTPTITRICQQAGLPPRGGKRITMADVRKLNDRTTGVVKAKGVSDVSNG